MTARPDWVKAVHYYLADGIFDQPSLPDDGSDDSLLDAIRDATNAILCNHYGHEIVDDHCGRPEHRYCAWCDRKEVEIYG